MKTQSIKIIGGALKGRHISFPAGVDSLRPTHARLRETLFNWLQQDINGMRCLDVFSGSGALGFEALSRGAAQVDFIEQDPLPASQLKKTAEALLLSKQATIFHADAMSCLAKLSSPYDLIFLDPPFHSNFHRMICDMLIEYKLLTSGGKIYFEQEKKNVWDVPAELSIYRQKSTSRIVYGLLEYIAG